VNVEDAAKTVRFTGQSDRSFVLTSAELVQIPPVVTTQAAGSHPTMPSDLKTTGANCPVVSWGGYTYWP
jgi:hypothetical protein